MIVTNYILLFDNPFMYFCFLKTYMCTQIFLMSAKTVLLHLSLFGLENRVIRCVKWPNLFDFVSVRNKYVFNEKKNSKKEDNLTNE